MNVYVIKRVATGDTDRPDLFPVDKELDNRVSWFRPVDWVIQTPVLYTVFAPLAGITDHPMLVSSCTVLSRRVADALDGLGGFERTRYDIQLVDRHGQPVGAVGDFLIFHVRTMLDVLDRHGAAVIRTVGRPESRLGQIEYVDELAVLVPAEGLPPCFYVKGAQRYGIAFNQDAHDAIMALGPKGFRFVPVPTRTEGAIA